MAPVVYLNPPPHPFWGFVADMQDHPFFGQPPRPQPTRDTEATEGDSSETKQQQASAEDPPEVDPSTIGADKEKARDMNNMPFRGRGRFANAFGEDSERGRECRGRRGCGRRGRGEFGGPFGAGFPWGGPGGPGGPFGARGPHPPPPGEGPPGPRGPHGFGGPWRRGGPGHHHHGPPPHHGGPRGRHSPSPPNRGPPGFDLGQFLNDLGSRVGLDLQNAAEGLGLDRFMPSQSNSDADFEPKADIFDRDQDYILHLSLPGAKKEDVGVDWDGEHSVLRIAGVVHRPGVDEKMLSQLVVDGRKRETGVFEKTIRLGTRRDPASIDVAGIKAKMTDGVLVVTIPKVERQHEKREVPIAQSQTPSPQRNEKQVVFDIDQEMSDAEPKTTENIPTERSEVSVGKQVEQEAELEKEGYASSHTVEEEEHLPTYTATSHHDNSDWENFGSDEEGDFVKINVD